MRISSLLGAALLAVAVVQPAAAFDQASSTGTWGAWQVFDDQWTSGAVCKYGPITTAGGTDPHRVLKSIIVRKPSVWGYYSQQTWVGWKITVIGHADGPSHVAYTSPVQKAKASNSVAAAFSDITVPQQYLSPASFTVKVTLFWYKPGSKTKWQSAGGGKVTGEEEYFDVRWGGSTQYVSPGGCEGWLF